MSVTDTDRGAVVLKKRRPALFHRIQTKLIVTFGLLFVSVLTVIELTRIWGVPFTEYAGRTGQEEARTFRELGLIADLKKSHLQDAMAEFARDTRMFADNDIVRINVARLRAATRKATNAGLSGTSLLAALRREESYHVLADYLNSLSTIYDTFTELHIVDGKTGTVLVSQDKENEGRSVAREAFFTRALQSRGSSFGDIKRSPLSGLPILSLSRAIADIDANTLESKADAVSAVLVLDIDVEDIIAPVLHTGLGLGETGEALLVNQKRRILTSLKHRLADGTRAEPLEHEIRAQPAILAAQGAEGIIEAEDYRGESVLAAYRHIRVTPEWGWGLVVKRDTSELFAPLRQDIAYSVAIGLAGILAVLGMTVYLARSLTRPIAALSRTAERVTDGDRTAYAPVIGSDEVAGLATTFNAMLHRIRNWHTELERQVELRTADLEQSRRVALGMMEDAEAARKVAEAAREELRQYEHIVSSASDMLALIDKRYVYIAANAAYLRAFAKTSDEVIGRTVPEVFGEEFFSTVIRPKAERCLAGENVRFQCWFKYPAAGRQYMDVAYSPYVGPDTEVRGFVVTARDITDRKQAEAALRESEEQFRRVVTNINDALIIDDDEGRIAYANDRFLDMFGFAREDMPSLGLGDFIAPQWHERLRDYHDRRVRGEEAPERYEFEGRRKDGSSLWLEACVTLIASSGKIVGTQSLLRDITERKRAEEQMQFQAQLLDSVHESVLATDLDGRITYWGSGAVALYGYAAEEVMGESIMLIVEPPDEEVERVRRLEVLEKGLWNGEVRQRGKDRDPFWVDATISRLTDEGGRPFGFIVIDRDITERKQNEERLRQQQAELAHVSRLSTMGEMAAGFSHELNQPLSAILSYAEAGRLAARSAGGVPERILDDLQEIATLATRAGDIIHSIRAFVRKREPTISSVDLRKTIQEVEQLLHSEMQLDNVVFRSEIDDDILPIMGDEVQIQQVLLNLLRNAVDAVLETDDARNEVAIRASANGDGGIIVSVCDNGTGLSPEISDRLFEPFATTKPAGLGMGLSISRSIIEAHGGHLTALRNRERGMTFRFTLPAYNEGANHES